MAVAQLDPDDPLAAVAGLPGVDRAVAATRLAVDRLAGHRVLRRRGAAVRASSVLRGAAAAATIELGRPVGEDEVRSATTTPDAVDPVVRGVARAYVELGDLLGTWGQAPRQVLARAHTLAARDVVEPERLGRPATDDAAVRLSQLADVLVRTSVPALVVAAVVHGELATLRPFGSADRVVALVASRLVLLDRGLDPSGYVVLEVGHLDTVTDEAALTAFASGTAAGVAAWISHYADVVQAGVREATAIAESALRG